MYRKAKEMKARAPASRSTQAAAAVPKTRGGSAITVGIAVEPTRTAVESLASQDRTSDDLFRSDDRRAAETLVRHLFASEGHHINGLQYAVSFRLAEGRTGGDIADVYHFDNGSVALSIADVSGKGAQAAVHAALIKFGLRCFASEGLSAERTLRSLDRVFLENNAFERTEQFASVFFGLLDDTRRSLTYASAGHEPVVLINPGAEPRVLPPTAPLVGVFDDQHHLFRQRQVRVEAGSLLIATTDGITEARSADGEMFGIERLVAICAKNVDLSVTEQLQAILAAVDAFAPTIHDDIAAFAIRIL